MEDTIEQVVKHIQHAAQGLEESKQVLYLLGPVGGGKSSLAEKLKDLMEQTSFYVLEGSPINETPLGLIAHNPEGKKLLESIDIDTKKINIPSPWALKRLEDYGGDITKFSVVKKHAEELTQTGITKTEPGDANSQDISDLVGETDIRQVEEFSQDDPDAYAYSGALNKSNQGLMEFVEMFKAPIKVLHPLLTATQEKNYNPTNKMAALPFDGVILAHSNESEWEGFRTNKNNEAFLDRVNVIEVPYCLRIQDEIKIYEKMISKSALKDATVAPHTYEMMAKFAILTRLAETENSNLYSKMRVYDGENLKQIDPRAKTITEYRDEATGKREGMDGISTRRTFIALSDVFNAFALEKKEISANPVHLLRILEERMPKWAPSESVAAEWQTHLDEYIKSDYIKKLDKEITAAYIESADEYGQNMFDRYITYADHWVQDQDFRDPDIGTMMNRVALAEELEKLEKPAGIVNGKDFRNEVVNFVLRSKANNSGENPNWKSYKKLKSVIEKAMFVNVEELLPVISFGSKKDSQTAEKHNTYIENMRTQGYTDNQIRLVTDYYVRAKKSHAVSNEPS